jgi:ParB family transcriptional regulator, chromosome partitioning protein
MASIREFGFCNPVLIDAAGTIIAGHGRVMAATRMKLETVPCLAIVAPDGCPASGVRDRG